MNPTDDGKTIRVDAAGAHRGPPQGLHQDGANKAEDGRVSVRNIRRHAKQALEKLGEDGEVGKDDVTGAEKRLDGMTKKHVDEIDDMLKHKEAELLEV